MKKQCPVCNHLPSEGQEVRKIERSPSGDYAEMCRCKCKCHDLGDHAPQLLAAIEEIFHAYNKAQAENHPCSYLVREAIDKAREAVLIEEEEQP